MRTMLYLSARKLGTSPAKLGVMATLLAVGLLLWGRLLLKEPPRVATAVPRGATAAARSPQAAGVAPRPVVRVDLVDDLQRNLFEFAPDRYKPTHKPAPVTEPAKSPQPRVDDSGGVEAVHEAARRLDLQSVITGSEPHAMINDQMLKVGDTIEGFKVVAVRTRSVVLERNGITVQIGL